MNKSWKKFTIIISVMLCVIIGCTAWNIALNKLTNSVDAGFLAADPVQSDNLGGTADTNNPQSSIQTPGGTSTNIPGASSSGQTTVPAGSANTVTPGSSSSSATPSGGSSSSGGNAAVLNFSKAQLVAYYNNCLKNSYSQAKMTDTKTEHVDVSVSGIDIGSLNMDVDKFANNIIANNTQNNDKPNTKTFSRGVASDGTSAYQFILPANLYSDAVASSSVSANGAGYVVKFTLKQESCSHTGTAKYNASCAWPLDINAIDFGAAVNIQSCTFNYPGTVLTANIDSQGRVSSVKVEMPLTVANAQGKALGVTIKVGSISGKWTCTNKMSF